MHTNTTTPKPLDAAPTTAESALATAGVERAAAAELAAASERRDSRRDSPDRRSRVLWSIMYGSFNPRRRRPPRRGDETRFHSLDWHSPHLLAVSVGILLLSVADAFMTVTLLSGGAVEVNPLMAVVLYHGVAVFAAVKMGMTGIGVTAMVLLAHYRFLRLIRVEVVMYALFVAYALLLTYEFVLLRGPS